MFSRFFYRLFLLVPAQIFVFSLVFDVFVKKHQKQEKKRMQTPLREMRQKLPLRAAGLEPA